MIVWLNVIIHLLCMPIVFTFAANCLTDLTNWLRRKVLIFNSCYSDPSWRSLSWYTQIPEWYSSSLLHAIIANNHMSFFKIFSNFVHSCPNFVLFVLFWAYLYYFWKMVRMLLLSRKGSQKILGDTPMINLGKIRKLTLLMFFELN